MLWRKTRQFHTIWFLFDVIDNKLEWSSAKHNPNKKLCFGRDVDIKLLPYDECCCQKTHVKTLGFFVKTLGSPC
jgi:hypothetical protein